MVDVKAVRPMPRLITLAELKKVPGLEKMVLLQKAHASACSP